MTNRLLGACLAALFVLSWATPGSAAELVMFEAEGCEWCETWNREIGPIYPKTEEGRLAPLRRVDLHARRPDDLKDIKGIVYTPTFVLVEGCRELGRIVGYPGEDFFWGLLAQLVAKRAPEARQQNACAHPRNETAKEDLS